ncbi:hypothetical protein AURDEDRAFT_173475 [Auricularia subglabra TFB-10046 SS5]|nr:hypothetical protein AURDEDRAFT_173475 [Auricularia subglabra TFB-10046 SS5]
MPKSITKTGRKGVNAGGKSVTSRRRKSARSVVVDGKKYPVMESWIDSKVPYKLTTPTRYQEDVEDKFEAYSFPPRDQMSTDNGWQEDNTEH